MKKLLLSLVAAVLIGSVACTNDEKGSRSSAAAPSSQLESDEATSTEAPKVLLDKVRFDCGPTDAIVISFEATAEAPFSGLAEFVVLGDAYGSVRVEAGPTPSEHVMDIDLSREAYEAGEGHVRVTSEGGSVVANEHVVRPQPGVGCG